MDADDSSPEDRTFYIERPEGFNHQRECEGVCQFCALPTCTKCGACLAVLDGHEKECPLCGEVFAQTLEEAEAGVVTKLGMLYCRLHMLARDERN